MRINFSYKPSELRQVLYSRIMSHKESLYECVLNVLTEHPVNPRHTTEEIVRVLENQVSDGLDEILPDWLDDEEDTEQ